MCDDPSQGQRTQGREVSSEERAIEDWSVRASDVDIQLLKERDMAIKTFDDICQDIYIDGQGSPRDGIADVSSEASSAVSSEDSLK